MFALPAKFVIFDLEWTTWEGALERNWNGPGEFREVVQIGAVLVEAENLAEADTFDVLVQPKKNPILSDYFMELTGITQEMVGREGIEFEEAMGQFASWCDRYPLYSWSKDNPGDPNVLGENCKFAGIAFPFEKSRFSSMQEFFKKYGVPAERYASGTIVRAFGKEPVRHQHNALNDARTTLDGLRELHTILDKKDPGSK